VGDQVREAIRAAADVAFLVAVLAAVVPGEAAHHPDELELAVELPHQPAQRGLGSP